MASTVFDYAIIGAGAAGLHLAMAIAADPYFHSKKLLIVEKETQKNHYPTWCFWEKGKGKWDEIISKSWNKTIFTGQDGT
ncbi:MAG: lycopene cyclase family protein, partial [Cyclobacteriaceae bacterium]